MFNIFSRQKICGIKIVKKINTIKPPSSESSFKNQGRIGHRPTGVIESWLMGREWVGTLRRRRTDQQQQAIAIGPIDYGITQGVGGGELNNIKRRNKTPCHCSNLTMKKQRYDATACSRIDWGLGLLICKCWGYIFCKNGYWDYGQKFWIPTQVSRFQFSTI